MPVTKPKRIESIDILRGIAMLLMCLDHARHYFLDAGTFGSPMDINTTTPELFFTRYITHFCAPVFVFLSGLSIFLQRKYKSPKALSTFLLTRGLWLIFLEFTLNNFLWNFDILFDVIFFQVIWAIGASMIFLAGLIHFNKHLIALIGFLIIGGHNLLDQYTVEGTETLDMIWRLLHQNGGFAYGEKGWVMVLYPILPWLGIMLLGYSFGPFFEKSVDPKTRKQYLMITGIVSFVLFIVLRSFNCYGDSTYFFATQDTFFKTIVSFFRISKYPPSLHFILLTIGLSLIVLPLLENCKKIISKFLITFGRVPLFFYFAHVLLLHLINLLLKPIVGEPWYSSINNYQNYVDGLHQYLEFNLLTVYLIWVFAIAILYYPCLKYMRYKEKNKHKKCLSYL